MVYCQSINNVTLDDKMDCVPQLYQCFILGLTILFLLSLALATLFFIFVYLPAIVGDNHAYSGENFWDCYKRGWKITYFVYGIIAVIMGIVTGFGCLIIYLYT